MAGNEFNKIDIGYVKKCLQANRHNALTSYYYLIIKRKTIEGEALGDEIKDTYINGALIPKGSQTKKYQSIEPQRTSLYNEKNKYQMRKIAEGLDTFNINRVGKKDNNAAVVPNLKSPNNVVSPI